MTATVGTILYPRMLQLCRCVQYASKIQPKQNHAIRLIFFARTLGELTESALPLLNLLDVLTVNNVYRLHILKFTHLWHEGLLPVLFQNYFQYARSIHGYNTRYASKQNLYKPKEGTNTGKQTVAFSANLGVLYKYCYFTSICLVHVRIHCP